MAVTDEGCRTSQKLKKGGREAAKRIDLTGTPSPHPLLPPSKETGKP